MMGALLGSVACGGPRPIVGFCWMQDYLPVRSMRLDFDEGDSTYSALS